MARQSPYLITNYSKDLRLFGSSWRRAGLLLLAALFIVLPLQLDDFWLSLLATVGIYAIGAIGLNLLTGYAGQVSLGHAFFFGVGAYCAAWFGGGSAVGTRDGVLFLDLPMFVWLPLAGLIGAALGALVGPVALRLSGQYLAIVSIGLLFVGDWILLGWVSATNGSQGLRVTAEPAIGPVNFSDLNIFGSAFSPEQGEFWFVWGLVAVVALMAKNIVRSRPGRGGRDHWGQSGPGQDRGVRPVEWYHRCRRRDVRDDRGANRDAGDFHRLRWPRHLHHLHRHHHRGRHQHHQWCHRRVARRRHPPAGHQSIRRRPAISQADPQ